MTAGPTVQNFLDRLENFRQHGSQWKGKCPAHDDHKASLEVTEGKDGRVVVKCMAGCATEDVVRAAGIQMKDLFPPRHSNSSSNGLGRIVKEYDYLDASGNLLFQVVRFDPKDFRQRRPDPSKPHGWNWSLKGVETVLYRLPEVLIAIRDGVRVYVVEGEKDADNLAKLGLCATTCPMGAEKWRRSYTHALAGASVVLIGDNDGPGQRHVLQVAGYLHRASCVQVVNLPNLPDKGDVSDWLKAGGTREELERLVAETPPWEPGASSSVPLPDDAPPGKRGASPPPMDLETLHQKLGVAEPADRQALIAQMADALSGDPIAADAWGQRLKEADFTTKTAFLAACDAAKKRKKQEVRDRKLQEAKNQAAARQAEALNGNGGDLPKIDASDQDLPQITAAAWDALRLANEPPSLFRHGSIPIRIEEDDHARPILRELTEHRCRYELARAAYWYRMVEVAQGVKAEAAAIPPKHVVQNVLASRNIPLPVLTRIVEAPVFSPDGKLQTEPGYHPASRTFYQPAEGFVLQPIPPHPTQEDVTKARALIMDELLGEFPFTSPAEKAHAVALLLQPFARAFIRGATPLYLFEKPSPGTGATLLAEMLTYPSLGHSIPAMTEGRDDDEWRKRLTSKLLTGSAFIFIDNLRRKLDSGVVAAAITASFWEDRRLGASEMVNIPISCAWIVTANNPTLSDEISRRTIRIRLDAQMDQPWLRDGFRHPDLRGWSEENRAELVWAALTIISAWVAAGQPSHEKPLMGQFESWSHVMGGILAHAGITGFLTNLEEFYEESNSEADLWRQLVQVWWDEKGDKEVGVADLFQLVGSREIPFELGDGSPQTQKARFGKQLKMLRDRQFTFKQKDGEDLHLRVKAGRTVQRAQQWVLRQVVKTASPVKEVKDGEASQPPAYEGEILGGVFGTDTLPEKEFPIGGVGDLHFPSLPSHPTGDPETVGPDPVPPELTADAERVFALAARVGYPQVRLASGKLTNAGKDAWRALCFQPDYAGYLLEAEAALLDYEDLLTLTDSEDVDP